MRISSFRFFPDLINNALNQIHKYPRTRHIRGSGLQAGDEDLNDVPFSEIAGQHVVVTEKVDGANCGFSYDDEGRILLQSRGHYLTGGPRERQFDLFKTWANTHSQALHAALGSRHVMYGEWLYAKHTVFYNALPHYFLEFDILDTERGVFLDSTARRELLSRLPMVQSTKVLHTGPLKSMAELKKLIGPSAFMAGDAMAQLAEMSRAQGLRVEQVLRETDASGLREGLYLRTEQDGVVTNRYKFVRAGFSQTLMDVESHWMDRPIVVNQLLPGVDLFGY